MNIIKRFPFLFAALAFVAVAFLSLIAGAFTPGAAIMFLCVGQLALLCLSRPRPACFLAGLTPEQVEEFDGILDSIKSTLSALPGKRQKNSYSERRPGRVSDECAHFIGLMACAVGVNRGQITGRSADRISAQIKDVFGMDIKTALTSSDIPLPTEYSGEVVELVSRYGAARRYGTPFPLGVGTVKLPKLKTDTTFTLLTQSTAITEKSPQTEWVTFEPQKFGGLIRLPTELFDDSVIPIGQWLARYCARNIARAEDWNFFCSTGAGSTINGSVEGLTVSTITNSKVVQMASTKTKYSDATLTNFRALRTVPDEAALQVGAYYLHPSFEQLLSTFNTAGDRPYNPAAQLEDPSGAQPFITGPTLDGFPIRWVAAMPAYSTSANVSKVFALFGDLTFQYLGTRGGIRFDTSLDGAFATDEILIRALERFTIGLMANGAIGGLQTAAS